MGIMSAIEQSAIRLLSRRGSGITPEAFEIGKVAAAEARVINGTFQQLGIRAIINTDNVIASPTGNFVRYALRTYGKIANISSVVNDLEMAISMHRGIETQVHLRQPMLALEMAYPLETRLLTWQAAQKRLDALRPFQAMLGMDYTADAPHPTVLDFSSKVVASGLIAGATGSGKTTLIANMIASLCYATSPANLQILFCDPKFDEDYTALEGLPHVTMFNEPADCITAIRSVYAELERRKRTPDKSSRIILFVDEYADLVGSQEDGGDELNRLMALITAAGRSKGIHVMLSTQKPTTEIVDTVAKGNLTVRIGGMVMTPKESEIVMGRGGVGCESLEGRGAFYATFGGGRVARIQSYYVDNQALERATNAIAERWHMVDPLRIELTAETTEPSQYDKDAPLLAKITEALNRDEIFDVDGNLIRGARAKILRLLFGGDARDVNTERRTLDRLLAKI
jgi:S-DNA-T family DNA segregation ATPase FtsK/SpoIIIE